MAANMDTCCCRAAKWCLSTHPGREKPPSGPVALIPLTFRANRLDGQASRMSRWNRFHQFWCELSIPTHHTRCKWKTCSVLASMNFLPNTSSSRNPNVTSSSNNNGFPATSSSCTSSRRQRSSSSSSPFVNLCITSDRYFLHHYFTVSTSSGTQKQRNQRSNMTSARQPPSWQAVSERHLQYRSFRVPEWYPNSSSTALSRRG